MKFLNRETFGRWLKKFILTKSETKEWKVGERVYIKPGSIIFDEATAKFHTFDGTEIKRNYGTIERIESGGLLVGGLASQPVFFGYDEIKTDHR